MQLVLRARASATRFLEWLVTKFSVVSVDQVGVDSLLSRARTEIAQVLPTRITESGDTVLVPPRIFVELASPDARALAPRRETVEAKLSTHAAEVARRLGHEAVIAVKIRKAAAHKGVRPGHPQVSVSWADGSTFTSPPTFFDGGPSTTGGR